MTSSPYERFEGGDLILRDELAMDRTTLANERTLLAYIRTALALAITGAGAIKFLDSLLFSLLGWLLICLAFVIMVLGVWRFRRVAGLIAKVRKPPGRRPAA